MKPETLLTWRDQLNTMYRDSSKMLATFEATQFRQAIALAAAMLDRGAGRQ